MVLKADSDHMTLSTVNDKAFRQKLENICKEPLEKQILSVEKLRDSTRYTIELVEETINEASTYNCYEYALGVHNELDFRGFLTKNKDLLDSGRIASLIKNGLLKQNDNGLLVIYLNRGLPKHAGILQRDGKLISKWGKGHLWEHELWGVPISYGSERSIFNGPDPKKIIQEIKEMHRRNERCHNY